MGTGIKPPATPPTYFHNEVRGTQHRHEARHRSTEHGVGTELGFVGRPIEFNHDLVNHALFVNRQTDQRLFEVIFDVVHGVRDAFAEVDTCVAVAKFQRLVCACGSPEERWRPSKPPSKNSPPQPWVAPGCPIPCVRQDR